MKLLFLVIFGSNLFMGSPQKVKPYQEAPANYVLDRGDSVLIDIWGASQMQVRQMINTRGQVTIEGCGPITVKGRTIPDAAKMVQKTIAAHYAGDNVSLSLVEPHQISVTVKGEVQTPNEYLIHGYSNLLMALQQAGGITEVGSFRQIIHEIKGENPHSIDLYDYLQGALDIDAVRLNDGDVIRVMPVQRLVTIEGLIKRPATYELVAEETAQDLISYANGITEEDVMIRVRHLSAEAKNVEILDMNSTYTYIPQDGDTISVVKVADLPNEVVHIQGEVLHKGKYRISAKVNTLQTFLQIATPMVNEKQNVVIVYRDTNLVQIGDTDMPMIGGERIYVLPNVVEVRGEVFSPTKIDYNKELTVADYIRLTGGFTRKAAKKNVYVVQPDGRISMDVKTLEIIPGCKIVIPRK